MGGNDAEEDVVAALVWRLGDGSWRVRRAACETLAKAGEEAGIYSGHLAEKLSDPEWEVREAACKALGAVGKAAHPHLLELALCLGDDQHEVRRTAQQELAALSKAVDEETREIVIALVAQQLQDRSWKVRRGACLGLAVLGSHALEHASSLTVRLADKDPKVREEAFKALLVLVEAMDDRSKKELGNSIAKHLNDCREDIRFNVCTLFGKLGTSTALAHVSVLGQIAQHDQGTSVRSAACSALGMRGESPPLPDRGYSLRQ